MTLRASLFDMDGLLLDSEILWHKAEVEIFTSLGVTIDRAGRSTKGMFVNEVVEYWYAAQPWASPTREVVVERLLERVGELVEREGRLLPGATRALDMTAARGPLGLASSTPMALIVRCLDHFSLRERFATINSAESEPWGKPHPGVFLSAASALGVAPEACLVFEDSAAGVEAGRAARMAVVAVPSSDDAHLAAFARADLVLGSLEDLDEAWLAERFSP
ncbi:MAG TPA: hexitol phosphatase HxpB [Acidimicrobiales bacterium]|nr:hexitol phosphatase HxpB [Acidimicrobiales bacterium]